MFIISIIESDFNCEFRDVPLIVEVKVVHEHDKRSSNNRGLTIRLFYFCFKSEKKLFQIKIGIVCASERISKSIGCFASVLFIWSVQMPFFVDYHRQTKRHCSLEFWVYVIPGSFQCLHFVI